MRGHAHACGTAVFAFDDLSEAFDGKFASTYVKQGSRYGTYHIAQETVAADGKDPLLAYPVPMGFREVTDVGLDLRVELGETGEIVILHQHFGGDVHQFDVGLEIDAAVESEVERQSFVGHMILIGACHGVEPSMGVGLDGKDVVDTEVGGKIRVEFESELGALLNKRFLGGIKSPVEMGIKIACMHTCICSATAHDGNLLAKERRKRLFDGLLNGRQTRLRLPTTVVSSIISQMYEKTRQNN